jgi:hypothetical protein
MGKATGQLLCLCSRHPLADPSSIGSMRRLDHPGGFSLVEANNRTISGFTGHFIFDDNIAKLAAGTMRGNNYMKVMRQMDSLGVSPSETKMLVKKLKEVGETFKSSTVYKDIEEKAFYRAAQVTQFTPGVLRRPEWWTHPVGRVMMQFKSFALNQGRFFKDQILAEAGAGNYKPLAYVMSLYPVAGEVVGNVKSAVRGKDRDKSGILRVAENFGNMGGFGLAWTMMEASQYRGGLTNELVGTSAAGVLNTVELLVDKGPRGVLEDAADDPTATMLRFGGQMAAGAATVGVQAARPAAQKLHGMLLEARERNKKDNQ